MIIYWSHRKSPLTAQEVDGNFEHIINELTVLQKRLEVLESKIESLSYNNKFTNHQRKMGFVCKDNTLTLTDCLGEVHEIRLPIWQFKGEWVPDNRYDPGNLVVLEKTIYRCCQSTCGPQFVLSCWEKIPFQVSTNDQ